MITKDSRPPNRFDLLLAARAKAIYHESSKIYRCHWDIVKSLENRNLISLKKEKQYPIQYDFEHIRISLTELGEKLINSIPCTKLANTYTFLKGREVVYLRNQLPWVL